MLTFIITYILNFTMQEFILLTIFLSGFLYTQDVTPEITSERKKIIIIPNKIDNDNIEQKILQLTSSIATSLDRYDIIDRSHLDTILKEQKLQQSGLINQEEAIEIGKISAANQALLILVNNFGQKGVPSEKKKDKDDDKEEPKTTLLGWVVKESVKAIIDKKTENVERYPNNIQTIIDGEMRLIDIETGASISSFSINADYTGGVKNKSMSEALKQIKSQIHSHLKSLYKLQSEVLDVSNNEVVLLLGTDMGVRLGTLFMISKRDEIKNIRGREITVPGRDIGYVKVRDVSIDASQAKVLRQWDNIQPGYKASEIIDGIYTAGMQFGYGRDNEDMRLRFFGNINSFGRFGSVINFDFGTIIDSREDRDAHFGFGFDLIYRSILLPSFSLGGTISLPFDFHIRSDDGNQNEPSRQVFLPILSPRIGLQSEIMVSSSLDLVLRLEYTLDSIDLDSGWKYSDPDEDSKFTYANWNSEFQEPQLEYGGINILIGFRSIFTNE